MNILTSSLITISGILGVSQKSFAANTQHTLQGTWKTCKQLHMNKYGSVLITYEFQGNLMNQRFVYFMNSGCSEMPAAESRFTRTFTTKQPEQQVLDIFGISDDYLVENNIKPYVLKLESADAYTVTLHNQYAIQYTEFYNEDNPWKVGETRTLRREESHDFHKFPHLDEQTTAFRPQSKFITLFESGDFSIFESNHVSFFVPEIFKHVFNRLDPTL